MVRQELKRPVENPVALKQLPSGARPTFTRPARILTPTEERENANELLLFAVCQQFAVMAVTFLLVDDPGEAVIFMVLLCLAAPWVFRPGIWQTRYRALVVGTLAYSVVLVYVRLASLARRCT